MENTYNSADINKITYHTITTKIAICKKNLNTKEKIKEFIQYDIKYKKDYLTKMKDSINKTILYKSLTNQDNNKYDLTDCTFIIPFKKDFDQRLDNLTCLINYISKHFNTNILIFEQGTECSFDKIKLKYITNIDYYYLNLDGTFSRTFVSNYLIERANTDIIIINDTDCITIPKTYAICRYKLKNENFKLLHPFGTPPGSFEITQKEEFMKDFDINILLNNINTKPTPAGVGGIVFINRKLYSLLGNENINFISYSPEDIERVFRIRRLGFKCSESLNQYIPGPNNKYIDAPLLHLCHPRTSESTILHKYYINNELLHYCLNCLNKDELIEYYYEKANFNGSIEEYKIELQNN